MSRIVLALLDDLMFASRIQVEAERAGATMRRVGSAAALCGAVREARPALVVIDLEGMGFDGVQALQALRADPAADGVPCLAYGSHVDPGRLQMAIAAGASAALPRSRFVQELPGFIARSVAGG